MTNKQPDTTPESDAAAAFVSTLGDEPEATRVLNVPEVIPVMNATGTPAGKPGTTGASAPAGKPGTTGANAPAGNIGSPTANHASSPTADATPATSDTNAAAVSAPTETQGEPLLEGSDAEAYEALKKRRAERRHKKLIRRGIVLGSLAGVLVLGGVAIALLNRPQEQTMEPITDIAFTGTFSDQIDVSGTLQPLSSTVVSPEIDGQVLTVNVAEGQTVNKGDVLLTIKNDELDRAVAQAERDLVLAKQGLDAAQKSAQAANAAQAYSYSDTASFTEGASANAEAVAERISLGVQGERASRLIAGRAPLPGTKSLQQVSGATPGSLAAGTENLTSEELQATSALEAAQEAYDLAVAKAAQRTVKAPCAGSIVALNVQVGAKLSELVAGSPNGGSGGPLVQIADLSKMKVTVQVGEEDIASVAVDQRANIMFPAFEGLTLEGRVTGIASVASADGMSYSYDGSASPSFAVDILIDAPDARLKPGMTAEVSVITTQLDNVVMVPVSALQTDDGENYYVNVLPDPESQEPERRDVAVVAQNDDLAVVGKPEMASPKENPDVPASPLADSEILLIAGGMGAMGGMGGSELETVDGVSGGMVVM